MKNALAKSSELVIIEDNPADYAHYVRLLDSVKHEFSGFRYFNNINAGVEYLQNHPPRCCLTDFRLPDGSAKDLIQRLITSSQKLLFPIVVVTGQDNDILADELTKLGVQDFLIKSKLTGGSLSQALHSAVSTFNLQKELYFKTHYDLMTGFINRAFFFKKLEGDLTDAQRFQIPLCLICVQIPDIQAVHDVSGGETANTLIKLIAENIKKCVEGSDIVARVADDEFSIILRTSESHRGHYIAQKLLKRLAVSFPIAGSDSINLKPAIGLAVHLGTEQSATEFYNQAHYALQQAKQAEGSEYKKYLQELDSQAGRRRQLETTIGDAINQERLHLHFLPTYSLANFEILSVEALVRWQTDSEAIQPMEILEISSAPNLTLRYHDWLFKTAFQQLSHWRNSNPNIKVTLNFSAAALNNKKIIENLFTRLHQFNLKPKDIIIDVAENELSYNMEATCGIINALASQDITIAIDNFGSGYSSIENLATLHCSQVKINQKFLVRSDSDTDNTRIMRAISALGHALKLTVVAEGIETPHAFSLAKDCGCDAIQGHIAGKPAPGHKDWTQFLASFDTAALSPLADTIE